MLVSIVIPCYNVEDYVEKAIESALGQTYTDIEIILVDNNSRDNTALILKKYTSGYPDKIIHLNENRQGAPYARNTGLIKASGQWIQFLDADDYLASNKIEHQINLVKVNQSVDVICGAFNYQYINNKNKIFHPYNNQDIISALFNLKLGTTSANLWKTETLKENNGWDIHSPCHQEYELMSRLIMKDCHFIADQEPLTTVRQRKGQITSHFREMAFHRMTLYRKWITWIENYRPEWYFNNRQFINYKLFYAIDSVGSFDLNKATNIFKEFFPNNYRPPFFYIKKENKYRYLLLYFISFNKYLVAKNMGKNIFR